MAIQRREGAPTSGALASGVEEASEAASGVTVAEVEVEAMLDPGEEAACPNSRRIESQILMCS